MAEEYGDERRSPLAVRDEAKAFSELELLSADPITVVMSDRGWIRAAKGHEIDPATLSYRSGDGYLASAQGRSNQLAMFVVYESPLQMLADSPTNYRRDTECLRFLADVPTVWDETRVLAAKVGDFIAVARRRVLRRIRLALGNRVR